MNKPIDCPVCRKKLQPVRHSFLVMRDMQEYACKCGFNLVVAPNKVLQVGR